MNRHQRRAAAKGKKMSRDATSDEIFPDGGHGPVQSDAALVMKAMLKFVQENLPGYGVTVFLNERILPKGESRAPRFNYASTEEREDMYAVLRAFLEKNSALAKTLDKIGDEPPTEAKN